MTNSQRLAIESSKMKQRLAEIGAGTDELSAELRAEADGLVERLADVETRWRAAVAAEGESAERARRDSEGAELRSLGRRAMVTRYLAAAATERPVDGAEAELRAAAGCAPGVIPFEAIAPEPRAEQRAAAAPAEADQAQSMSWTLDRVFAMSDLAALGAMMQSVPAGVAGFPYVSGSATPATFKAANAEADEAAVAISVHKAEAKRLTITTVWPLEAEAGFADLERSVRMELSGSFSHALDTAVMTGDGTAPNPAGLFDADSGVTQPSAATVRETYSTVIAKVLGLVDGVYAYDALDLRCLIGAATLARLGSEFATSTEVSALDWIKDRTGACRVSARVPAVAAMAQKAIFTLNGGAMGAQSGGSIFVPFWGGGMIATPDRITLASKGQVRYTLAALYDVVVRRPEAVKVVSFSTKTS